MQGLSATQFCLEIGFGVLFALAFVPRAPVGALFYRILGTAAVVPILLGVALPVAGGRLAWSSPLVLAAGAAVLAWPVYSGPVRGARWAVALGVGLAGSGVAVVLALPPEAALHGPPRRVLAGLSALATGSVAGSVGLAMVLGHWYLTVPNLPVRHLQRLNRVAVGCMLASLALVAVSCLAFRSVLASADTSLFAPWGLFQLGTRVGAGLVLPLVFAAMAASALRFRNTRSATGILYASTVLVLIGTAGSVSLQGAYGLPL